MNQYEGESNIDQRDAQDYTDVTDTEAKYLT